MRPSLGPIAMGDSVRPLGHLGLKGRSHRCSVGFSGASSQRCVWLPYSGPPSSRARRAHSAHPLPADPWPSPGRTVRMHSHASARRRRARANEARGVRGAPPAGWALREVPGHGGVPARPEPRGAGRPGTPGTSGASGTGGSGGNAGSGGRPGAAGGAGTGRTSGPSGTSGIGGRPGAAGGAGTRGTTGTSGHLRYGGGEPRLDGPPGPGGIRRF